MARILFVFCLFTLGFSTLVSAAPAKFAYQGQIIKPDSQPLEGSNVTFLVEILSPNAEACLLFQESHTINMNGSNGLFSLEIGSGTRVGTDYEDTNPLATALSNSTGLVTPTTCDSVGTYNPSSTDGRKLRVTFDDGTGPTTLAQDHNIVSVPYAANASSIDGLSVNDLVRINNGGGVVLTQSNLESVFGSAAMVTELLALINGTSTQYSEGTPSGPVDMNSQRVTNVATPTGANDAANKDYADDNIGGQSVDQATVDALGAGDSGEVLTWTGTQWTSSAPSGDSTKLPLAGGTMSGGIAMGNQDITNIKDVAVNNDVTVGNDLTVTNNVSITGGIGVGTGINSNGTITVENQNIIRFGDADSGSFVDIDYVGFRAPAAITAPGTIWTLPAADGTAGQILSTDGSGVLSWVSDSAPIDTVFGRTGTVVAATSDYDAVQVDNTAAGNIIATNVQAAINELDTEKVAKSGDQMTGALQLNATNEVRFADADSSNYVGFASPGIVGSNQIWVLPNVDGNSGEYLQTDGSGQLTFAPAPTAPVTSVYGRTGVVVAATSDYDAVQVDNTAAGTISATNVQAAINELDTEKVATTRTLSTAADSGLAGGGDLSANRSLSLDIPGTTDLGAPAVGADSLLIYDASGTAIREVTRTQLVLSESEVDSFVANNGFAADADKVDRAGDTMTGDLNLDNEQEVRFSEADVNGVNYVGFKAASALAADQIWTLPIADGASGEVLQTDGAGNLSFVALAAAPVDSVFGRTGAVTAATSDYDAIQVDNTAAGTISATNVQAAINELDTEKVATTRTLSTAADSGLAGGGDLSANRSLSLDIPGTTDLGAPAAGADSMLIYDASGTVIREVTRTQLVLSESEVDAFVANNGFAADADKVDRAGDTMTGDLNLDNEQEVRFSEADVNGVNYVGFKAASALTADQVWTLPVADGSVGQVLQTDGAGNLSFVAIAAAPVDSVFGRTGAVTAATSDYDAIQVDNTAAGTISATNVQAAINELDTEKVATTRTLSTAADSGLAGGGDLSANRSLSLDIPGTTDLGAPAVGADSLLIYDASGTVIREVTRTQLVLSESEVDAFVGNNGYAADADKVNRAGDAMTGNLTMNASSEVRFADADSSNFVGFASPAIVGVDLIWTLPASDGASGQVLQTDGSGNLSFVALPSAPVTSVHGRTGAVTAATSDYDAIQVDNTAAGTISATNVQAAINELDTEKVATTRTLSTAADSGLAGGGDLSANRSLSLDIPGTTDLGAPAAGADSMLIYDASGTVIREVTRTQLVLSESEVDAFVANNGFAADADKVDRAGDTMTGDLNLDNEQEVRFSEADVNGINYVGFKAASALTADQIWTLPVADGTAGQVLQTDGAGNLSFAAIASAPVDSVFGRTGAVTAATSDYDAIQVDNTAAGTISATNVQAAINELDTEKVATTRTLSTAADSGLAGGGDLSANRSLSLDIPGTTDLGAPAAGADSMLIYDASGTVIREVTRTQLVLSESEVDAFVANNGFAADADKVDRAGDTMTGDLNLDNEQEVRFSEADVNGINYVGFKAASALTADQIWTLPVADGTAGQVLQTDGAGNLSFAAIASAPVDSVFGRTGAVTAATSDYDAIQVDNTAAGTISATNVQAAINELDTEKVATTRTLSTAADSGLAGGGDLSANRSLSLDIPGTTDLGAPAAGADSMLIYDASGTVIREVTRTQLVLSESEVDAFVANNGFAADADKVDRAGDTMTGDLNLDNEQEVRFSEADVNGINYVGFKAASALTADQIWTLPVADGTAGQVLQTDGAGNLSFAAIASAPVDSVFGRTGAVTAATSDYDAIQVDNTAAGTISATNVQAAINELDTEKVATTRTLSTAADSGLAGGGDLSANRSLSLDIPGTTDLGAPAAGADSMLIYDASGTVIREVTRTQLVLSESEVDAFVANNGFAADADKVDRAGDTMTGDLNLDNEQEVRFSEADVNGINYVGFKAASALTADQIWTLPVADGTAGQVLQTDGAGNLSFAAIASAPVDSVFGRTGAVTAATSDYDAIQVDNTAAGTISATNVQAAINELDTEKVATTRTLSTAADSGLAGGGDFSANRSLSLDIPGTTDLGAPAAGADSMLIYDASGTVIREVTRTQLVLSESEVDAFVANNGFAADADKVNRAGDAMTGNLTMNATTEVRFADADSSNFVGFASPAIVGVDLIWTLPASDGTSGQVLQTDGSGNLSFVAIPSAPVTSVHGRTGVVTAATSDYDAIQVDNTAAGTISATNVQAAINELDTEKVATTRTLSTAADSGLAGGGDLSANRTLSLDIPGTTDLGAPAAGADSMLIYDASGTVIREVTRTQLVLSESEVDAFVANNGFAADADKVDRAGDTMTGDLNLDNEQEVRFSEADVNGVNYVGFKAAGTLAANQIWTLPIADGSAGQVLQTDGAGNLSFAAVASAPVDSVFGRTGAVTAATSDYDAIQVDNTAAGTISATNVQAAINELDTEKVATTRTLATAADSGLAGGGDLSANRSLSLDIPGTTDLGAPAAGADSMLIYDASGTVIREVTRTQLVLSESEVDSFVANNGYAADADKVNRAGDTMTGDLNLDNEQEVRFSEADVNGINYVGFKAASALTADQVWTLPVADGSAGQVLQTDGAGNLSFVAIASAPVTSVYGRTGVVTAATSDYDAIQVDNTAAGTISATNVQAAINELDTEKVATTRTLATAADSGLAGGGDLSANRTLSLDIPGTTDLGAPAAGADSMLIYDASGTAIREVTRTQLVLSESEVDAFVGNNGYAADADKVNRAGDAMTGNLTMNATTEVRFADADSSNFVGFASPAIVGVDLIWTLPASDGTSGQVLQTDGSGNLSFVAIPSAPVTSVYGRTGVVTAATSDYDAIQVDNTAAGTISATNVQAAINELDTEKVATTRTLSTAVDSGLAGGGDLSANRSLSLDIPGTTDLGAPAVGADSLLIYDASGTAIREVTRTQLVLSESEVDSFVANNGFAADADKVDRAGDTMTGDLNLDNEQEVRFSEADVNGVNYVGFKAAGTLAANQIWTLPIADGSAGQVLQTDGAGNLSFVAVASAPVTSVYGRTGVVTAATSDYDAIQVDNTAAGTISATNVQAAINELDTEKVATTRTLSTAADSGLAGGGDLSANRSLSLDIPGTTDLGAPAAGADSMLIYDASGTVIREVTRTQLVLSESEVDSFVANNGYAADADKVDRAGDTMTGDLNLDNEQEVRFSEADVNGVNYVGFKAAGTLAANQVWTLPIADGSAGQVLQTDGAGNLSFVAVASAPVTSVYGRTGVVTAATSDYDAIQVDNTAAGTISATNVQAAINELDTEKVATTRTLATAADSGLAGGGDLSANRSLSLDIPGTTDLGAPAVGADSLLIYDASGTAIREVTRTQLVLSESEVDSFVGNNGYAADADKVNRAGDAMTGNLTMNATTEVRFADADSSNFVGFASPAIVGVDLIWTLPASDGTSGQVLQTDGSGNLSFVAIPSAPVTSVYGRTGVVTAATSDYDAIQVDNTAAGTISATNVQAAINELDTEKVATTRTLSTAADSGLAGGGDLSANRSLTLDIPGTTDLGAPAAGADSMLIYDASGTVIREVTRTQLVLSESEVDSFVANNGFAAEADKVDRAGDTMTGDLNLDNEQEVRFSEADVNGVNYVGFKAASALTANQVWTLPIADGSAGQVLQTDGAGNLSFVAVASAPVTSVYGRTGVVTAATSDYDAIQVDNTAAGTIAATNVQAAINELDTEKVATTRTLATAADSGLAGGGDLSANRSLSLDIPGTTDLGAPAVGDDSLLIFDASGEAIREVTRTQLVLSESEVDSFVANNGYAADADKVNRAGDAMTGNLTMNATTEVRFADADSSNHVGFASPAIVGVNQIWTLPASDGTSGQVLQTNGSGVLSWTTASGGVSAFDDLSDGTFDTTNNILLLGAGAGASLTTANTQLAIGRNALNANTTGNQNLAIGNNAMNTWTSIQSLAIGHSALESNTGGANTTAVGMNAGYNGSGYENTIMGYGAMWQGHGSRNVALGGGALMQAQLNSDDNIAIGLNALKKNDGGDNNIVIGREAAEGPGTYHYKNRNVILGNFAGALMETADDNIMIGHQTGDSLTTGDGNILIGTGVEATVATASNELNIGNTLYGNLTTASVGIGTSAPNEKLTVEGGMSFKEIVAPTTDVATYHKLYVDAADNKLKFRSEAGTVTDLLAGGGGGDFMANGSVVMTDQLVGTTGTVDAPSFTFDGNTTSGLWSPAANTVALSTNSLERFRINSAGNVGVGTTNPNEKLTLEGGMSFKEMTAPTTDVATYHKLYVDAADNKLKFRSEAGTVTDLLAGGGGGDFMADGSVAMSGQFDAADGTAAAPGIAFGSDPDTGFYSAGSNRIGVTANGVNMGRFDASDGLKLYRDYNSAKGSGGGFQATIVGAPSASDTLLGEFTFGLDAATVDSAGMYGYSSEGWTSGSVEGSYLTFRTTANGTATSTEKMRITSSGNIGIGTTSPNERLTLEGGMSFKEMTAPTTDVATYHKLYVDAADNKLKFRDEAGTVTDLLAGGGGASAFNDLSDATWDSVNRIVLLGAGAGASLTTADTQLAIGQNALNANATGNQNLAIGDDAMNVWTGLQSLAVGHDALKGRTGGYNDTAVGVNSGSGSSGSSNTLLGYGSFYQASGSKNVALGSGAMMWAQANSNENIAIGHDSLHKNNGGDANVVIGIEAAKGPGTNQSKSRNTIIGSYAGTIMETADDNVLIGYQAGDLLTTGDGNILIGTGVDATSATASNELNIGNALYGNLTTGNVGIGTTTPASKLHVDGVGAGGGVCVTSDGTCSAVPTGGQISAETTLNTGADYAEYFESEEDLKEGDLVSLNPKTGKARGYRAGDALLGIVSTSPGVIGNSELANQTDTLLVALVGQVPFNQKQTEVHGGKVLTLDKAPVGHLLANGMVYINLSSANQDSEQNQKISEQSQISAQQARKVSSLEQENAELKRKYEDLQKRLENIEKLLKK